MHICPSVRKYSPFSLISYIDNDLSDHQNERLPQRLSGTESAGNAGATGDMGVIPVLGRLPGEGNGNPLQDSCLENSLERRSLAGYSPWGLKELNMTEAI